MFRSYFLSWKWARTAYGGAFLVFALTCIQVQLSLLYNDWLYTLGSVYSGGEVYTLDQLNNEFATVAIFLAVATVAFAALHAYVSKKYCWCWYQSLMESCFPNWNKTLRDINNPSERLQDSTRIVTEVFFNLSKAVVQAGLMLAVFIPKLWEDSEKFNFFALGHMKGMLFWLVLAGSLLGCVISALVGYNLKRCKYDMKSAYGYLRSGLEYVQRNKNQEESIFNLKNLVRKNKKAVFRLYDNEFWFDVWMGLYTQFWAVAPKLFFGFNVFSGYVKYANVTKAENELNQVYTSISTPIWFWGAWTEYLSVAQRVRELQETINNPENWKEAKREDGWNDRRGDRSNKLYVVKINGKKVSLTNEEYDKFCEEVRKEVYGADYDSGRGITNAQLDEVLERTMIYEIITKK